MARRQRRRVALIRYTCLLLLLLLLVGCGSSEKKEEHHEPEVPAKTWQEVTESVTARVSDGDMSEAIADAEEALALAEASQDATQLITSYHNLGKLWLAQGEAKKGIKLFEKAVEAGEHADKPDHRLLSLSLNKLAAAHYAEEHPTKAREALQKALGYCQTEPMRLELLQNLQRVAQQQGLVKEAQRYSEEVRLLRVALGEPLTGQGAAVDWLNRKWPSLPYRAAGLLLSERVIPPNRTSASSRFWHRAYPVQEEEEAADSGHAEAAGH